LFRDRRKKKSALKEKKQVTLSMGGLDSPNQRDRSRKRKGGYC